MDATKTDNETDVYEFRHSVLYDMETDPRIRLIKSYDVSDGTITLIEGTSAVESTP